MAKLTRVGVALLGMALLASSTMANNDTMDDELTTNGGIQSTVKGDDLTTTGVLTTMGDTVTEALTTAEAVATTEEAVATTEEAVATTAEAVATTQAAGPCDGVTCNDAGSCKVDSAKAVCECNANRTGDACADYVAYYDHWPAFGDCSDTCGTTAFKTRTRNCTDTKGTARADGDCSGFGDKKEEQTCTGLPECVCTVHPCNDFNDKHTNGPCNPLGGEVHKCVEKSKTVNGRPVCQKTCSCGTGYKNPVDKPDTCEDVDECSQAGGACFNSGTTTRKGSVKKCQNMAGDYFCVCADGYEKGKDNKECVDVNECATGAHNCDDASRAECTNIDGSFTCKCKTDFTGDGTKDKCLMDRFILTSFATKYTEKVDTAYSEMVYIPGGGYTSSDDGKSVINSFYGTRSGLIVFTSNKEGDPAERYSMDKPNAKTLKEYSAGQLNEIDSNIVKVDAVNWADNKIATGGGFYVRWIPDMQADGVTGDLRNLINLVSKANSMGDAKWACVVTWDKMRPNVKDPYDTELNSFQAVVVGGTNKTKIIVRNIYQDRGMNWKLTLHGNPDNKFYPVRVGTMSNNAGGVGIADEYTASGASIDHSISTDNWRKVKVTIDRLDRYKKDGKEDVLANIGLFDYEITAGIAQASPAVLCKAWLDSNDKDWTSKNTSKKCPGTLAQIKSVLKANYDVVDEVPTGFTCYQKKKPLTFVEDGKNIVVSSRCCYDQQEALLGSKPSDVELVKGKSTVVRESSDIDNADSIYPSCCTPSYIESGLTPASMCTSFLDRRPAGTAELFNKLAISQLRGDPHITTLDDVTYTFNGHGEFTMIKSKGNDFHLQGRTSRFNETGDATVFTGFAGQYNSGTVVQLSFSADYSAVELYINKQKNDTDWNTLTTYGNVKVYNDSGAYAIAFDNGVVAKITANSDLKLMTVSMVMNPSLQNDIAGLMGNYNGNNADDFEYPNGTASMNSSAATEEELYPWGLTWMTTSETTLFDYSAGGNWSTFNDASFTPVFFNPNLTVMFPDATKRTEAIGLCNGGNADDDTPEVRKECYFDYKVTDNKAAAEATVAASNKLNSEKTALNNFAPVFNVGNNTIFKVEVGKSYANLQTTYSIKATDANDGDVIKFSKTSGPDELTVTDAGVITWNGVKFSTNDTLEITASDGKASAVFIPQVIICDCKNGGTCVWDGQSTAAWSVASCQCATGWTGDFCTDDIDGCAQSPCFTACTDVRADQVATRGSEFLCDPCPTGLGGDGQTCYDINECRATSSPCEHNCENTAGSFICSCNTGYALAPDGRKCGDLDECLLGKDDCDAQATCANTVGSWKCTCKTGYAGAGTKGNCQNVDECAAKSATCPDKSNCVDTVGSYKCPCFFGYKANGKVCENIDECSLGNKCDQKCTDGIASYTCDCDDNFVLNTTDLVSCDPKTKCETADKNKCDNGNERSTCAKDTAGNILCYCPKGYTLNAAKVCVDVDECTTGDNVCSAATSTCTNKEPRYECTCKTGFQKSANGITCEDIDECAKNTDKCVQTCTNTAGGFVCSCGAGFKLNADELGCDNVDECKSSVNNRCDSLRGNCTDQTRTDAFPLGYTCGCQDGYALSADGFTCNDLNECNSATRGGCTQGCSNNIGSHTCYCGNGYTLNAVSKKTCDDVDECASANTHNCYDNGHCTNTVGGYTCTCPTGFKLKSDGFTCESILKCAEGHGCNYTCSVISGNDTCQCPRGYEVAADMKNCMDVDECKAATPVCPAADNVVCVNVAPGYHCTCKSDKYTQVEKAKCIDVDECATGKANCSANSYCSNKDDGYDCKCNSGYADDGSGTCANVNECNGVGHACSTTLGVCTDTVGSYTCACKKGYAGDGITCTDVNECVGVNTCDPRAERGTCTNTVSSFTCGCSAGYVMAKSGTCNDINECNEKVKYNITCAQVCTNTPGSVKCGCQDGYMLAADGKSCAPQVACTAPEKCTHGCMNKNGADTCTCKPGYELAADNKTCSDIDECATNTSTCDKTRGTCSNTVGAFTCGCKEGYNVGPSNECDDRDGGFGNWTEYSTCTKDCGNIGEKTRSRPCDSPTPAGNGATCLGDAAETVSCNRKLCPAQLTGISMKLAGPTVTQFKAVQDDLKNAAVLGLNGYCTLNANAAKECCNATNELESPVGKTFLLANSLDVFYSALTEETGVLVVLSIAIDDGNEVCSAKAVSRRKRATTLFAFPQAVLLQIVSNSATLKVIENAVQAALTKAGYTVTLSIKAPTIAEQVTPAPSSTPVATTKEPTTVGATDKPTTVASAGVEGWVIAVAVVGALLAVVIIVIIIVIIIKRPKKVGAAEQETSDADAARRA